jgi:hypothetical protein
MKGGLACALSPHGPRAWALPSQPGSDWRTRSASRG